MPEDYRNAVKNLQENSPDCLNSNHVPEFLLPDQSTRRTMALHSEDSRLTLQLKSCHLISWVLKLLIRQIENSVSPDLSQKFFSFKLPECIKADFEKVQKYFRDDFKKKNCKISDIVQKGGEGSGKW